MNQTQGFFYKTTLMKRGGGRERERGGGGGGGGRKEFSLTELLRPLCVISKYTKNVQQKMRASNALWILEMVVLYHTTVSSLSRSLLNTLIKNRVPPNNVTKHNNHKI